MYAYIRASVRGENERKTEKGRSLNSIRLALYYCTISLPTFNTLRLNVYILVVISFCTSVFSYKRANFESSTGARIFFPPKVLSTRFPKHIREHMDKFNPRKNFWAFFFFVYSIRASWTDQACANILSRALVQYQNFHFCISSIK